VPVADLSPLFQPLALAGTELPNRVMTSAMTLQYGDGGFISDRHLAIYEERARGGVGLMFSEQLTASPLSPSPFASQILAYDERQVERFAALAERLAPYPSRFFAQLFCGGISGSSTAGLGGWQPVRGPSRVGSPGGETPLPLSAGEIETIVADFARSARHVKEGGLDGVEIHGAHGWLLAQFLSPFYNRREDQYGGTVANRCRFAVEVGRAIRAEVGPDFPLGIALTYDERIGAAGITEDDTLAQLDVLLAAGVFDFFDLSIGSPHSVHFTIAPMAVPEGFSLDFASRARELVDGRAAVFAAGRVVDPAMAAAAVRDGAVDMVAMSRAHLADPHLVRKAREGKAAEIRRCVGANVCVGRAKAGEPVACVLSPATGRELDGWPYDPSAPASPTPADSPTASAALSDHAEAPDDSSLATADRADRPFGGPVPAGESQRVLVIGAGPAGLRAGAVLAARGHEVTVYERRDRAGGHLADLATLPTRGGWANAVEDLLAELGRSGATLRLATEVDRALIDSESPDFVLLAAGAEWESTGATSFVPAGAVEPFRRIGTEKLHTHDDSSAVETSSRIAGASLHSDGPSVLGLDEAIELARVDPSQLGASVLIADDTGTYAPLGLAEALAAAGASVRFLTARGEIGTEPAFHLELPHLLPRLRALGVDLAIGRAVTGIDDEGIEVADLWGGPAERIAGVDTVVFALRRRSRDGLSTELAGAAPELLTIGDALTPRPTAAAIEEAERVALSI
jgi:2,4-dienoyl-CoA reductase-like NADH-dependent reductase (Old Yellow Enzyme family)/ribulose 1,5-bisphosphate synthetase/thiazole synthase